MARWNGMKMNPRDKAELLGNLKAISESELCQETDRNFALALAYIVADLVPDDRTTRHVFKEKVKG